MSGTSWCWRCWVSGGRILRGWNCGASGGDGATRSGVSGTSSASGWHVRNTPLICCGREHRWLPGFAPRLPLPVPTPLYLAEPSELHPQPWSMSFIRRRGRSSRGCTAIRATRRRSPTSPRPRVLAQSIRALHGREVPDGENCELSDRQMRNARCEFGEDLISVVGRGGKDRVRQLEKIWQDALSAADWDGPPVWAHNDLRPDLHPANVVVMHGALSGVIYFGELAPGGSGHRPLGRVEPVARRLRGGLPAAPR
jgi:aminoglycoside phosphotransferase (APT) family kinase protein